MGVRIDRFTWGMILVVLLLLAGAVITVSVTGGEGWRGDEYLDEDSPAAAVHNAFLASLRNEPTVVRQYYSTRVLEEVEKDRSFPERFVYYPDRQNQRLRILNVEMDGADRAFVTVAIDRYSPGGLFDSSSTYTRKMTLPLVREADGWKIDTADFFY